MSNRLKEGRPRNRRDMNLPASCALAPCEEARRISYSELSALAALSKARQGDISPEKARAALLAEFPELADAVAGLGLETPIVRARLKPLRLGAAATEELFMMSTLWADRGGDIFCSVLGTHNLQSLCEQEFAPAANMCAGARIFRRASAGPVAIMVSAGASVEQTATLFVAD